MCHGIPSTREFLKSGDIVNVDVSTIYKGYFADASRMFMIGEVSPDIRRLVQVTKECRDIGIQTAQPWARLGDVGAASRNMQKERIQRGTRPLRTWLRRQVPRRTGCGTLRKRGTGMLIVPGMTFTIEPMINMGSYELYRRSRRMDVCTDDGLPSANGKAKS